MKDYAQKQKDAGMYVAETVHTCWVLGGICNKLEFSWAPAVSFVVIPPASGSVNQSPFIIHTLHTWTKNEGMLTSLLSSSSVSRMHAAADPFQRWRRKCLKLYTRKETSHGLWRSWIWPEDDECNPISREKTVLQSYFLDDADARKQQQRKIHRDLREQEE